jgi:hypothetical protein
VARRSLTSSVSLGSVPRWLAIVGIIVGSRLVSTAMLLVFANGQPENPWTDAHPDLFEFSRIWDSHWYRIVAEVGYPSDLPIDHGRVGENAWAFLPVYPMFVRGLMALSGATFAFVSVIVSTAAFAVFIVLADRLFRRIIGDRQALGALAVIAFAPVAPIFQVGYAESLGMVFLTLSLIGLVERRWWLAFVAIPLTALTRPLGVPLALTVGVLFIIALRTRRDRGVLAWLTTVAGASAFAWPALAWLGTGRLSAYLETELAWRRSYIGNKGHGWGSGWIDGAKWWFHESWPWVLGALALVVIVIAMLPATRRLGTVALAWLGSYAGYLILVLFPQSSVFRLLAPMFPLAGAVAKSRAATWIAVILGVIGQYFWVEWMWSVQGSDWTPP